VIPKVTIKFAFLLSRKIGKSSIDVNGRNFSEIVAFLKKEIQDKFSQLFNEDGTSKHPFVFMLNGKVISKEELLKREFRNRDTLQFFLPLAGG